MLKRRGLGLSISARINLALGTIVALLIVLEISGVTGFRASNENFARFSAISDVTERMIFIDRDATSMDRLVRRYADGGEEANLKFAREFATGIGASLTALAEDRYAGEAKSSLSRMQELLAAYSAGMAELREARVRRDNIVNLKLNGLGPKPNAALTQIMRETAAAGNSAAAAQAGLTNDQLWNARLNAAKYAITSNERFARAAHDGPG